MKQRQTAATAANAQSTWDGLERRRVEKVVETLAALRSRGESIAEVAHDARNMVTALNIYCDLLEMPGVLGDGFAHYAQELRLVAAASRRLVEKLLALDEDAAPVRLSSVLEAHTDGAAAGAGQRQTGTAAGGAATPRFISWPAAGLESRSPFASSRTAAGANRGTTEDRSGSRIQDCMDVPAEEHTGASIGDRGEDRAGDRIAERIRRGDLLSALPIANLAAELVANQNLLAALAGPSIALTIETDGGAQGVRLTAEDLTRLLVNLVKNAAEAMPRGGCIDIRLHEIGNGEGAVPYLALTIEDDGQGIPEEALEKIFTSGYTSRERATEDGFLPQTHRGLGLAIVRSIVEGTGGRITAANRPQSGACFTLELPVRKRRSGSRDRGIRG
ncbi:MAG: sensor histidine kinase [Terracidiphilus sp.]